VALEVKTTALPPYAAPLTGAEIIHVVQDGTSKRSTVDAVAARASGGVTSEAATTYSPVLSDANGYKRIDHTLPVNLVIQPDSIVDFPVGTTLAFEQANEGVISYVQGAGVTINRDQACEAKSNGRYTVQQMVKVAVNMWTLYGNLKVL
jgi:hypothetical protein